jgi:hypothetical protein
MKKILIIFTISIFFSQIFGFEIQNGVPDGTTENEMEIMCGLFYSIPYVPDGEPAKKEKGCVTVKSSGSDNLAGQIDALNACEQALSGPNVRPDKMTITCKQTDFCGEGRKCIVGAASNTGTPMLHSMTTSGRNNPSWSKNTWTVMCCGQFSSKDPMNIGCPCPECKFTGMETVNNHE